jgi:hypothetical protein
MAGSVQNNPAAPTPFHLQQEYSRIQQKSTQPFLNPLPMRRASPPTLKYQSAQARGQSKAVPRSPPSKLP